MISFVSKSCFRQMIHFSFRGLN